MVLLIMVATVILLVFLGFMVWMDEQLYKTPHIPETDIEKRVRDIRLRIADANWKLGRNTQ